MYYIRKPTINQCEALYIINSIGIAYHQNFSFVYHQATRNTHFVRLYTKLVGFNKKRTKHFASFFFCASNRTRLSACGPRSFTTAPTYLWHQRVRAQKKEVSVGQKHCRATSLGALVSLVFLPVHRTPSSSTGRGARWTSRLIRLLNYADTALNTI